MAQRGRPKKTSEKIASSETYLEKVNREVSSNQSRLNMILGTLIVLVIGILVFNFFNRNKPSLGPSQQTEQTQQEDVTIDKLPGKYIVKEGDTLFTIAEKYYGTGDKFTEIVKANNLSDADLIITGQVLEIPKLEEILPSPTPTLTESGPAESPSPSISPSETPTPSPSPDEQSSTPNDVSALGTGGGNTTIWGPKIETTTYTVQEGDWLSTISARTYGDVFAYKKIAEVNNISNPDYIVPGMVLTIPR